MTLMTLTANRIRPKVSKKVVGSSVNTPQHAAMTMVIENSR